MADSKYNFVQSLKNPQSRFLGGTGYQFVTSINKDNVRDHEFKSSFSTEYWIQLRLEKSKYEVIEDETIVSKQFYLI